MSAAAFDPTMVNLDEADPAQIVCYLNRGENDYDGRLGARVSALFVILVVSSAATFFPVVAARVRWVRINLYVYLFARYFGAGVIVATAFIHLLDPAYGAIGPDTCVGMTGHWADYAWCPAIVLTSITVIFLLDFGAEQYVERKYGFAHGPNIEQVITGRAGHQPGGRGAPGPLDHRGAPVLPHHQMHSGDPDSACHHQIAAAQDPKDAPSLPQKGPVDAERASPTPSLAELDERSFRQQIAAVLILEFGVVFHSVIIGLNLGTVGAEFDTLYPVLVFHQSFEGLGLGARLSAIPFPPRRSWLPWVLCAGYGLTTPLAIAIGLGLRHSYNAGSFTASVVSGVLDATSAGILIYTGLVELLARDFLFNPALTRSSRRLTFMLASVMLGMLLMSLLGKWA
ncbi:hypothetical protein QTJ16_003926 [Diplocarpon rosae]|uniref:Uncharacterized protein n=1 Tax=Diplocarpon rosae TaxID=946125 RepID=A0AAD9SZR0_9HELO|nr:hypothetical protein QTJ16_003926 [Diplocarpon rosae]